MGDGASQRCRFALDAEEQGVLVWSPLDVRPAWTSESQRHRNV